MGGNTQTFATGNHHHFGICANFCYRLENITRYMYFYQKFAQKNYLNGEKALWISNFLIVNFTYISCEINPQIEFFAFYISFFVNFTQMDNFHVLDVKPNGGELYIFYQFVCSLFAIICSTFLLLINLNFL